VVRVKGIRNSDSFRVHDCIIRKVTHRPSCPSKLENNPTSVRSVANLDNQLGVLDLPLGVTNPMAKKTRISPMYRRVLSSVFKKPATGKYPFVKCVPAEDFRGKQVFDISLCVSCGLCSRDCPAMAI
jgi:succinate dehydrogenase/fumarate reductase-like Fe-S protein